VTAGKPPTRLEVHVALGLAALLLFSIVVVIAALGLARRADFGCFYTGGVIVRQGNASRLYNLGLQGQIERQVLGRERILIYLHPPFESLWFAALAGLSYVKAYVLWGAINVVLWLFFQHWIRPHTLIPRNSYRYFLLCSLFVPLWVAFLQGQTSMLLLLLFSLSYVSLKRGQDFRAGVFLGLGLFKYAVIIPFAFICLLRSKWRLMAGLAATACVLGLMSVMLVGRTGMWSYVKLVSDTVKNPDNPLYGDIRVWEMATLKGFFARIMTGRFSTVAISALATAASAFLVLFVAWRWRQEDRRPSGNSLGLMFAAALTVTQVTSPYLLTHELTLMLLAGLLATGSLQWSGKSWQRAVITVAMVILYTPPVYVGLIIWHSMYLLTPVLVAFALAAMSLARKADVPPNASPLAHFPPGADELNYRAGVATSS
jgi:hypothetical protein